MFAFFQFESHSFYKACMQSHKHTFNVVFEDSSSRGISYQIRLCKLKLRKGNGRCVKY